MLKKRCGNTAGLPYPLRQWNSFERRLLYRGGDPARVRPDTADLDPYYLPEARAVFQVLAYWIEEKFLRWYVAKPLGDEIQHAFFRKQNARTSVLFLVHPLAQDFYAEFLRRSGARSAFPSGKGFWGSPTSSTRTLLTWREGVEDIAFFSKLSLPFSIGNARRTLTSEAIARSVGVTKIIDGARAELPPTFKYLREPFGVVPIGLAEGGFIVRPIPREVVSGDVRFAPLFSLYAHRKGKVPWLAHLIEASGIGAKSYLEKHLLRPFAEHWLQLAIEEGFIPEPHAQNLLVEVTPGKQLTGTFVHRDFEGFYIDFAHRAAAGKYMPKSLPAVTPLRQNYKQTRLHQRMFNSVDRYFQGSVLYDLDNLLPDWHRLGLVSGPRVIRGEIESAFVMELQRGLGKFLGRSIRLGGNRHRDKLVNAIILAREMFIATRRAAGFR